MPSFDIASKIDVQTLDNALNNAKKEIQTRYDFRNSKTEIEVDKKALNLTILTEDSMRLEAIIDIISSRMAKQGLDTKALDFGKEEYASGNMIRKEIKVRQGIDKEEAKKIVKIIKDSNLKVQAAIMDDIIRVTGKKIDDLQSVIALLRKSNLEIPLQYINMKA